MSKLFAALFIKLEFPTNYFWSNKIIWDPYCDLVKFLDTSTKLFFPCRWKGSRHSKILTFHARNIQRSTFLLSLIFEWHCDTFMYKWMREQTCRKILNRRAFRSDLRFFNLKKSLVYDCCMNIFNNASGILHVLSKCSHRTITSETLRKIKENNCARRCSYHLVRSVQIEKTRTNIR